MADTPDPPLVVGRMTALSDIARLRMLRLLAEHELSVGELARALQLPQSTVSRHLKVLHDGRWILKRQDGTASLYRQVDDEMDEGALALWRLARDQLGMNRVLQEDDRRLVGVLAERPSDSREFFGRLGGDWDILRRELFGREFTTTALLSLICGDWVVADLGCGTGDATEHLAPLVRRVIAVDREPAMLDAARRRLGGVNNVDFRQGCLTELPIEDDELDAALMLLVMHHLDEPADVVREIARVLKPGGILLAVDMVAHDRQDYRHTMGHRHLGFDEADLRRWATEAGLTRMRFRRLPLDPAGKGPGLFVATMRN